MKYNKKGEISKSLIKFMEKCWSTNRDNKYLQKKITVEKMHKKVKIRYNIIKILQISDFHFNKNR